MIKFKISSCSNIFSITFSFLVHFLPQVNGADFSPHYELYEPPYYHQGPHKRSHYDKDYHKDTRDDDGKNKNKGNERDRPFSDDFVSMRKILS